MLPLVAGFALNAGGNIINNLAEQGANRERQGIVKQGLASQQGFRNNLVGALDGRMQKMSNVQQQIDSSNQSIQSTIGNTLNQQQPAGLTSAAYRQGRARMAIANTERKGALAKALSGTQGFQAANLEDGMQRSQLASQFGDINRQSQAQLFQDQQRLQAVRPNAGMQFLGEGLKLGAALGGVL